ncbi:hypothetical protein AALP_AA1G325200 [Arabis alpina]|uniref:Aminotransferase-like plant mobile domain-containing protein n=1 Tax=Arabis alpina TaxID=50452 RepID=A0A087HS53_ARAAL|nr:hypothetical protein AALP_AA1G325200 [Arabis alpina]
MESQSRGSSDQEDERIVQIREALMCPDGEKFEGLRTARFLNYTTASIDDDVFELPLDAFAYRPESIEIEKSAQSNVRISFSGWGSPSLNWIEWVNAMAESYATVWRKSGVHDAILASRYEIKKQEDLMIALIEKWCIETNTFVFPWGEATFTLEDLIVLGGFSVIGNNVMAPIKRDSMKEVEEKMKKAKKEIEVDLEKKCCVSSWMKEMMNSGNDIEHEAFMVSWLSRFVFPNSGDLLRDKLFPAAIQLANGVKLALAPAVLAGVYRDLGVLKDHVGGFSEKDTVVVKSPFQFVQVWAMERFMELQPPGQPSELRHGEPRIARWQQHGGGQDVYRYPENVRAVLDSAKESFDYRPYTKPLSNFKFPKFYLEDDCWVRVGTDENIVAFGRCLRFCKLVGLDCVEPYYPHRVGLQFGYDQDVPGVVQARTETPELAWKDYIRPISDEMLYIPARLHEADVTVGYIRWWKLSAAILQAEAKKISNRLLASSPKPKPVTTPTKATSLSPGKSKTSGVKAGEKDQEKKRGTSVTGSEQATKQPLKKPEWVQRSSPASTKSPDKNSGRVADDVKDLKGALRGSGGAKGQGHVTFQLPGSSPGRSPPKPHTLSPKQTDSSVKKPRISIPDSPVKKPRMLPRVVDIAKQSTSSPRVPRHTSSVSLPPKRDNYIKNRSSPTPRVPKELSRSSSFSGSPLKRKKSPRSPEDVNSRSQRNSPSPRVSNKSPSSSTSMKSPRRSSEPVNPCPRVSEELNKSPSSSSLKKSPKSLETTNSCGNSSAGDNSLVKRSIVESPSKTQLNIGEANVKSLLEEMVTLREHVGEGGEVTYQIPKQQFEDLSQGVQDVLQDLQSIKFALNIQDDE